MSEQNSKADNSSKSNSLTSIAARLFYGEVDEACVFPYPQFEGEQVEMAKEMCEAINRFGEDQVDSAKFDQDNALPKEILQGFAEMGLCGLAVPEELGGMELDYSLYSRVFSEVAALDGAIATTLGAHQSIGYRALLNEGTDEQKQKWLPQLASGEKIAAFCLTEPGSGSDAYSIKTRATKNDDGTYTITGQKLWITNAGLADFYTVFAKTEHEKDGKKEDKITCFVVEKDAPGSEGLSFGEKEDKMGIRASETRAVFLDKVRVPEENILGELGKGFKVAMNVLNSGRLSLGSGSVGGMKYIIKMATEHANSRQQFGRPIAKFGLIQEKLASMSARCYAAESVVYLTTGNIDRGMKEYSLESAICKIVGSEALWDVIDMGMQIAAGNGYMKEYPYERIMRDSRINLIFEGTNEILRVFVALSGMKGPSESLKELGKISDVSKVMKDPIKSVGIMTDFARKRISSMFVTKTLTFAHRELEEEADQFSSLLSSFSIQVENTLIKYGKNIIGNEYPQGRIANMAIELYTMLAVISRTTAILDNKDASAEKKDYVLKLTKISLSESRHRFMSSLKSMSKNTDKVVNDVSEHICKQEGYGLDIVDY